jgi:hypothetical protein
MPRPGPQTHAKRAREAAKRDKRRAKDERRAARKAAKKAAHSTPQPLLGATNLFPDGAISVGAVSGARKVDGH